MGPFDVMKPWSTSGVEGANRFLGRVWRLFSTENIVHSTEENAEVLSKLHQTIKKVGEDIEAYKFNTAISSLMELVNFFTDRQSLITNRDLCILAKLLAPFAPHLAEEVWVEVLHQPFSIHKTSWPSYDITKVIQNEAVIVIQINGKVRGQVIVDNAKGKNKEEVEKRAREDQKVANYLKGRVIKKTIFIPGKLMNFVV
jgi:leucyl-tRNA synthetase